MNKVFKKYFYLDEKKPSEANLQAFLIPNYNLLIITSIVYFVIQLGFLIRGITNNREFSVYFPGVIAIIGSALIFAFSYIKKKKATYVNTKVFRIGLIVIGVFMGFFGIYQATYCIPETQNATLAICVMALIPLIFNLFPIDSLIQLLLMVVIFIPMEYNTKKADIFVWDMVYNFIIATSSQFLCFVKQKNSFKSITTMEKLLLMNEKLLDEAKADALTGLLNKKAIEFAYINMHDSNHGILAFVLIDIDNFKLVNDYYGHPEGDKMIVTLANALKAEFKESLVGRIGGDEFAVILTGDSYAEVEKEIKTKIKNVSSKLVLTNGIKEFVSAGIYITKHKNNRYQYLYFHADKALYEAKARGKKQIYISSKIPMRMLIIDDNEINRKIVKKYFDSSYIIDEACDGKEALDLIYRYRYDYSMILLDLEMPKINGFEVLNTIRNDEVLRDLKIVVVTSHSEDELRSLKCGADEMISKPFNQEIFKERVERLIN